jgi:ABC-2 type transport system permease protein
MLWYRSWLETRWRFLIGFALLLCSAAGIVIAYPQVLKLLPLVPGAGMGGEIGRQIEESVELARDYRGYVWSRWFQQNLTQLWTLFAILLGTGGLLSPSSRSGVLYTLSLPVSRNRLLRVRVTTGLAELLVLALVPSLLIPVLSPSIGQAYGVGEALLHGGSLFVGGSLFFSLAILLSTEFDDVWRPLLLALCVALALGLVEQVFHGFSGNGVFRIMSGESLFQGRGWPWLGMLATVAVSGAMLLATAENFSRRDF